MTSRAAFPFCTLRSKRRNRRIQSHLRQLGIHPMMVVDLRLSQREVAVRLGVGAFSGWLGAAGRHPRLGSPMEGARVPRLDQRSPFPPPPSSSSSRCSETVFGWPGRKWPTCLAWPTPLYGRGRQGNGNPEVGRSSCSGRSLRGTGAGRGNGRSEVARTASIPSTAAHATSPFPGTVEAIRHLRGSLPLTSGLDVPPRMRERSGRRCGSGHAPASFSLRFFIPCSGPSPSPALPILAAQRPG